MLWSEIYRQVVEKIPGNSALADQRPFIFIEARTQLMHWVDFNESANKTYPVSTAANGLGNRIESLKTPIGIHRIKQKIGGGEPPGMVFKARQPTGQVSNETDNRDEDKVTSRILWLDGMEKGFNNGGVHDSYSRYIYIHGTSDEKRIGQSVSHGCIRMKNLDVIELFDEVLVNDLVIIQ
jgi:lipoprotein-anchoring transpeptidase ErfK/SrfK